MYDLKSDPGEVNNLYGKPEYLDLQTRLVASMEKLRAAIPERKREVVSEIPQGIP